MNAVANVAAFQPPRLPYDDQIGADFGINSSAWRALVEAVFPLAKTASSVVMALSYCKARNLDPFKKPVHIVPMWDSKAGPTGNGGYIETVWPGISEIRTTAFRTGQYAGCDETEFGPTMKETFTGQKDIWENRKVVRTEPVTVEVTFPEWARLTVYREQNGTVRKFVGPKVYWLESYAQQGKMDVPNTMWADRPIGQIEKCAEAAALRKAFPEEIGNDVTAEEMHGRRVEPRFDEDVSVGQPDRRPPSAPPKVVDAEISKDQPKLSDQAAKREPSKPAAAPKEEAYDGAKLLKLIGELFDGAQDPDALQKIAVGPAEEHIVKLRDADHPKAKDLYEAALKRVTAKADQGEDAYDPAPILTRIKEHFDTCDSEDSLEVVRERKMLPLYEKLSRSDQERATHIYNQAQARIRNADAAAGAQEGGDEGQTSDEQAAAGEQDGGGDEAAEKALEQMSPAEYEAHVRGYTASAKDPKALKTQWFGEAEARDKVLGPKHPLRQELKAVVFEKVEALAEGA